jgi:hypothetical protein
MVYDKMFYAEQFFGEKKNIMESIDLWSCSSEILKIILVI